MDRNTLNGRPNVIIFVMLPQAFSQLKKTDIFTFVSNFVKQKIKNKRKYVN